MQVTDHHRDVAEFLSLMPPIDPPLSPTPGPSGPIPRSEIMPLLGTRISLFRSRLLIPIVLITLGGVATYALLDGWQTTRDALAFYDAIGATLLVAIFYLVYFYAGETENSLRYWLVGLATYLHCKYLYWALWAPIFRKALAPDPFSNHGSFVQITWNFFISAGLCEELLKATPILVCLAIARFHRRDGSLLDWFALKGPLDGLLMGVASALLFTFWETLEGYVAQAVSSDANVLAGLLSGLVQTMLRILDSYAGHVGYSGIFGYFIGLAATHRSHAGRLILIGWLMSAAPHGLWDGLASVGGSHVYPTVLGLAVALLFAACVLKARQLEAARLAADGSHSILATAPMRLLVPTPTGGIVPPSPGGLTGAVSALAGLVERSVGVTARTTPAPAVPASGLVPSGGLVPPSGLAIGTGRVRYALAGGRPIDFSSLFATDGVPAGYKGTVDAVPGGLAIRNTGAGAWTVLSGGGSAATVPPGGSFQPGPGTRLMLGPAAIDLVAFAG